MITFSLNGILISSTVSETLEKKQINPITLCSWRLEKISKPADHQKIHTKTIYKNFINKNCCSDVHKKHHLENPLCGTDILGSNYNTVMLSKTKGRR